MEIQNFIICDDVRHEQGNKFSIMGVYADEIHFAGVKKDAWPIPFRIGCFIRLKKKSKGLKQCKFNLKITHGKDALATANGEVEWPATSNSLSIPLVVSIIKIPGPGALVFKFEIRDGKKTLLKSDTTIKVIAG